MTCTNSRGYTAVIEFFFNSPTTGDSNPVVLLASLLVLGVCGMIMLRKRKTQ